MRSSPARDASYNRGMSVVASPLSPPGSSPVQSPAEPFGQTGVRQFVGRILAWLFLTVGLCAAAMAHRSTTFFDRAEWRGRGQMFKIVSGNAQLQLVGGAKQNPIGGDGPGWSYGGGYDNGHWGPNRAAWQTDFGQMIGFEVSWDAPGPQFDSGFRLRFQWLTIAVVFLVWPFLFVVRGLLRWVRGAPE